MTWKKSADIRWNHLWKRRGRYWLLLLDILGRERETSFSAWILTALQDGKPLTMSRYHLLGSQSGRKLELLEDIVTLRSAKWHVYHTRSLWMSARKHAVAQTNYLTWLDKKSSEYIIITSRILTVILNINSCVKLVIYIFNIFQQLHITSAGSIIKITGLTVLEGWFNSCYLWRKKSQCPDNQYHMYFFWTHFCQTFW